MTRWLSGIAVLIVGFLPSVGLAQGPWPQSGFPATGYIGDANPGGPPSAWGDPYAQLRPGKMDSRSRKLAALMAGPSQDAWIRFDLLHWRIKGAEDQLVGAPVAPNASGVDFSLDGIPPNRLGAIDRVTGARPLTFIVVPRIGDTEEAGLAGFRGSFGVPTSVGDFEFNGFIMEEHDQSVQLTPFQSFTPQQPGLLIGAVTLLNDGNIVNDTMLLFSEVLNVNHTTNLYGFEANLVNFAFTPNVGIEIRPIVGVRYMNLEDRLLITGTDIPDPLNDPTNILNRRIMSRAQNHIIGPQLGFRASSKMKRFTLGTDLKFLFGINRVQDQVSTDQIFSMTEVATLDTSDHTEFAPTVDFAVYGKFEATEHINFTISYQALVGAGYSRSYDTIDYNAPASVNDPPIIDTREGLSKFYAHGLTLGVEIVFP